MDKLLQDKLLLVGSGMLHDNLAIALQEFVVTPERGDTSLTSADTAAADVAVLVESVQPRWIVYAGPSCSSAWDHPSEPSVDWMREAEFVGALAAGAEHVQAKFVLLSTDAIFAGPRLFHEEDSTVNTTDPNVAGRTGVEQAALRNAAKALVLRSHAFGWSCARNSFAENIYAALANGQSIALDSHSHATPMLAGDLAAFVERALHRRLQGLCHCTGAERTNQVRFAQDIAAVAGFDSRLIRALPTDESLVSLGTPCRETSLNCRRARRAFETPMPMLREGIERMIDQVENGYREQFFGGTKIRELIAA